MNGKKEKKERKLILVGGWQGQCVPAMCVMVGAMGWLACPQRVAWWWDRGGTGCSSNRRLCQGGGDVVGVAVVTRLGTTVLRIWTRFFSFLLHSITFHDVPPHDSY